MKNNFNVKIHSSEEATAEKMFEQVFQYIYNLNLQNNEEDKSKKNGSQIAGRKKN